MTRCPWARTEASIRYHDEEWGVPVRDDRTLFEFITLEGAQAGLSWETVLSKRARYREVFFGFDIGRVARMTPGDVEGLLKDPGIIRHRGKIESTIGNARAAIELIEREGSLAGPMWGVVGGSPRENAFESLAQVPPSTPESDAMSRLLKRAGFRFVGSTICYALMQACGLVNDHLVACPRWGAIRGPRSLAAPASPNDRVPCG